jgi:hypothetical protein
MTSQNLDGARATARALLSRIKEVSGREGPARGRQSYHQEAILDAMNAEADPASAGRVVANADKGDAQADLAVREAIERLINEGPLPEPLRSYCIRLVRGEKVPIKRGRSPHGNRLRDQLIVLAVKAVTSHGFNPTRNRESEGPSASSIVSEVLAGNGVSMSVTAVEKIWQKRKTKN